MNARLLKRLGRDDGASAVEFALVWILLALFLVGMVQFGLTFNNWLQIAHAAREGARWASLRNDDVSTRQHVLAATTLPVNPNLVTIAPSNPGEPEQGKPVVVTVSFDSPVFGPIGAQILGGGGSGNIRLTASATQMVE